MTENLCFEYLHAWYKTSIKVWYKNCKLDLLLCFLFVLDMFCVLLLCVFGYVLVRSVCNILTWSCNIHNPGNYTKSVLSDKLAILSNNVRDMPLPQNFVKLSMYTSKQNCHIYMNTEQCEPLSVQYMHAKYFLQVNLFHEIIAKLLIYSCQHAIMHKFQLMQLIVDTVKSV